MKAKIPQNASSEIFLRNSRGWGEGDAQKQRLLIRHRVCIPKAPSEVMTLEKEKGIGRQAQGQRRRFLAGLKRSGSRVGRACEDSVKPPLRMHRSSDSK